MTVKKGYFCLLIRCFKCFIVVCVCVRTHAYACTHACTSTTAFLWQSEDWLELAQLSCMWVLGIKLIWSGL